ncbi:MAG: SOS response-associated peptidase [Bacteroidales bacterium]|nr:SOS response-associated peptidase [Bacteroidales bacterium]
MCFSVAFIETTPKAYVERFGKQKDTAKLQEHKFTSYYFVSAFEYPQLPIVTEDKIFWAYWGLIPHWTKDMNAAMNIRSKTVNARCETLFEKPSFRKSARTKRCLLGISGFYEWHHYNDLKIPFFISAKNAQWLTLACIYDDWVDQQSGEIIPTFSIITIPANDLMSKIHNTKKRMPLILKPEQEEQWISSKTNIQQLNNLFTPISSDYLHAYSVSTFINDAKNNRNVPQALEPYNYNIDLVV